MPAKRTDRNQVEIINALRSIGATVQDLHEVGKGCPDILVGYHGRNYLFEIKTPDGELNEKERQWAKEWKGLVSLVRYPWQAIEIITDNED